MPSKKLTKLVAESLGDQAIQIEVTLPVRPRRQENPKVGQLDTVPDAGSRSRIHRITRLMALAIKFQDMVDRGEVRDYADLARLGYVTRARITQIMNLLNLDPTIQAGLLDDCAARHFKLTTTERNLREVSRIVDWADQKQALSRITRVWM